MTNDYLKAFHGASLAPRAELEALVTRVMHADVLGLERITQGYANEVYRASLSEGPPVYVRIRRHGSVTFADEAWAIEACRREGVPVPKVHMVTTLEAEAPLEVMVLEAVPGRPLGEVWPHLPEPSRREVMAQLGTALRTMHSVEVQGWGRRAGATWDYASWRARAEAAVTGRKGDMPTLREVGFSKSETDAFMAIVGEMLELEGTHPVLCHGDIGFDHLYVEDVGGDALKLTGVIDFGMWQGGPRELDFAMLSMYHPDVPLGWLESGYENVPFDGAFYRRVLIEQVNTGTSFLAFDVRRGNLDYLPLALAGLRDTLTAWWNLDA